MGKCHRTLEGLEALREQWGDDIPPDIAADMERQIEVAKRLGGPICIYAVQYPKVARQLGYPDDGRCIHPELEHHEFHKCPMGTAICRVARQLNAARRKRGEAV